MSRHLPVSLVGAVVALTAALVFGERDLMLHFDPERSSVRLGLLAPVVCVMILHVSLGDPLGEMEDPFPAVMRGLRLRHVGVVIAMFVLVAAAYAVIDGVSPMSAQVLRNVAVLAGLLLVWASLVSSSHAWLPPAVLSLGAYGFGVDYSTGQPRGWAVLFHDVHAANVILALGCLAAGSAAFVLFGPRVSAENGESP